MPEAAPSAAIPRPDPNTYWVEPDRFLAGEYPFATDPEKARAKLKTYLDAGIDTFFDLTEAHELEPYSVHLPPDVQYRRMSVRDLSVPSARHMHDVLDAVDAALAAGRRVYIHCWGGVGRTGTAVACWLQRHGRSPDEALSELAGHWATVAKRHRMRRSPETDEQIAWVRNWPAALAALGASTEEKRP